jgi:DNA polymerase-3 subunit delta'
MRLERLPKESGTDLARSITVDQVRSLQRLFSTTASMSPWRVVIIDAIDDLERPAANALLKNLEEPPPTSLFPAGQPRAGAAAAHNPLALQAAEALALGR